ncbi:MAG: phosphodiester glycosidase family protein [bacterium]
MKPPLIPRARLLKSFFLIMAAAFVLSGPLCEKKRKNIGGLQVQHQVPVQWKKLAPGLAFTRLSLVRNKSDKIKPVVLRIEPRRYGFVLLSAPALLDAPAGEIKDMADKAQALAAINGSFYLPDTYEPIGLVVSQGSVVHKWHPKAGSGLFIYKGGKAEIVWARQYDEEWEKALLALQAGPLLVEPGGKEGIYENRKKHRHRSALGIDEEGRVLMLCTLKESEGDYLAGPDLYELMKIMMAPPERGGLGAERALNLDGGASSSLYVRHAGLPLNIPSANEVRNGIAVKKRK